MNQLYVPEATEPRPGIKRDTTANDHIIAGMDKAKGCAKWLIAQGFVVLAVSVGRRNPRIEIQACNRCSGLQGAVYFHERSAAGVRRGWVALRFDCEVRWSDGGAA